MYNLSADRWEQADLYHDPAYAEERAALHAELARHATAMAGQPSDWLAYPDCEQVNSGDERAEAGDAPQMRCDGCATGTGGPLATLGVFAVAWRRRGRGRGDQPPRRSRSA